MELSRVACDRNIDNFLKDLHTEGSEMYKYKFKNLVLAGGGAKGVAYCGVARALEQHGILNDINRFAGTSAGAIIAALLCLGFNSYDLEQIMNVNMTRILENDVPSLGGLFNNIRTQFGILNDNTFDDFLGMIFAMRGFGRDINFHEVYTNFQKELCIVVTNANTMSEEYCHVKTTPFMPILKAVRMSMSIPGLFTPVRHTMFGKESLYIDGGLVCNYPIHCFDGWYLSMDNYMPAETDMYTNPFNSDDKVNTDTLGCVVYSDDSYHPFKDQLEKNCSVEKDMPDTALKIQWDLGQKTKEQHPKFYVDCKRAMDNFLAIFAENEVYTREEFERILNEVWETEEREAGIGAAHQARTFLKMLNGQELDVDMIFSSIKKAENEQVHRNELCEFSKEVCSLLLHKYRELSQKRRDITGLMDYMTSLFLGLSSNVMKLFFKEKDVVRTVGINTGYIEMQNFHMEVEDRQFLIEQGQRSTKKFLENFVKVNTLERNTQTTEPIDGPTLTPNEIMQIAAFEAVLNQ